MHFVQLIHSIPVLDRISSESRNLTLACPEGCQALVVVRRGHITITARDQTPAVCTQAYACHPEYGPFTIEVPRTKLADYTVIHYRLLPHSSSWTLCGPLHTISEDKIHYMLDELLRTEDSAGTLGEAEEEAARVFRTRMMLERILFIYLYETGMKTEARPSVQSIEESLSYINEHYMLKLTLPMLARRAGVSEGHYTVLFKKHTGASFVQYLHRIRIEKAKQLFIQTELSAKTIAQQVGFGDYFHFSKTFKKITGKSPVSFRSGSSTF